MLVRLGFCGLVMAALCACSGGVEGGGSGSGGENSTTGGSAPAACASAALCNGIYLPSSCDFSGNGSTGSGSSGSGGAPPSIMAAADMRCVLTKLRDHEVGYMSVFVESHATTGCGIRTEIVSFGDGTASVQDIHWADIGVTPGTPERVMLKSKDYFDTCLAGSDEALAGCVQAMTTSTPAAGPTCPCRGVPGAQDGQCKSPF